MPVYPCVYREHVAVTQSERYLFGLSLCIQGTRAVIVPVVYSERFIPVYTGNTAVGDD